MQLHDVLGLDPFFTDFDRLAQGLLDGPARFESSAVPMDVVRRGDALHVIMDLPGREPDGLDVSVDGRVLTVTAARRSERAEGEQVFLRTRPEGTVRQQLALPDGLDLERIEAGYEGGVLTLTIPLTAAAKPRRVEIRHAAAAGEPKQIHAD